MRRDLAKELGIRVKLRDDSVPTIDAAKEKGPDGGITFRERKQVGNVLVLPTHTTVDCS